MIIYGNYRNALFCKCYHGVSGHLAFFLICELSMHSKRGLYFDGCQFLLFGGPLNVIGVFKFEVY